MDNSSIIKIQKNLKKYNPIIIKSDDTSIHIKEKYGEHYLNDISDSDDDGLSYKKRNSNIIKKLPDKNNSDIKQNIDTELLSTKSFSVKNTPLRSTIKNNIKILDNDHQDDQQKLKQKEKEIKNNQNNQNNQNNTNDSNDSNDCNDDCSLEEYEFKDDFENQVKTFLKIDDKIKELQKDLKDLNTQKKVAQESIMKHLERLGETNINITGGKLIVNKYGSKGSFKEDIVKDVLLEEIKDKKKVENIFEKIQEIREENSKIQINLKRTSVKKK